MIAPDGYMLTNWHVVADSLRPAPDTIWVTMADQSAARFAGLVATSRERDIALIKVRRYQGPHLTAIEVISIHRAGLRQGPGFALSVPVRYAIPLMPVELRERLGIQ